MPSREELLHSIRPDMRLTKAFFLKIYGYEITWPGFAEKALQHLEVMGCSKARAYYSCIVQENENAWEKERKEAAAWYTAELEKRRERKAGEERRKERVIDSLEAMSDQNLLRLWQRQKQQNPEAF